MMMTAAIIDGNYASLDSNTAAHNISIIRLIILGEH